MKLGKLDLKRFYSLAVPKSFIYCRQDKAMPPEYFHGRLFGASVLGKQACLFFPKGVAIPVAVSVFPDELYPAPRSWAEKAYPKLIHYNRLPKGGHFAAWEQPELFSEEIRLRSGRCASGREHQSKSGQRAMNMNLAIDTKKQDDTH